MNTADRQALVVNYLPLANSLAWEKSKKTPFCVTIDDLKSAAYLGLVKAAHKAETAENFYPHARIKGEILDYLRSLSWGKRGEPGMGFSSDFSKDDYASDSYRMHAGIMRAA